MSSHLKLSLRVSQLLLLVPLTAFTQKPELVIQAGHSGAVTSVAFSPDRRLLASGSLDKTVKLSASATGQELRTLRADSPVHSIAFSPDSNTLASGVGSGAVKIWDVLSGRQLRVLTRHSGVVNSVAFSSDGKILASGSEDKTIRLWDASTGQELRTLTGHSNSVRSIAFSGDARTLAGGGTDEVNLWDTFTGKVLHVFTADFDSGAPPSTPGAPPAPAPPAEQAYSVAPPDFNSGFLSIAFSRDGKLLAGGSAGGAIILWDAVIGNMVRTLAGHSAPAGAMAFNSQGDILASGGFNGEIKLWNVRTGEPFRRFTGHSSSINSVAFDPDDKILASGGGLTTGIPDASNDDTVRLWDISTGKELYALRRRAGPVQAVAFSPDGSTLSSADLYNLITLWSVGTGQALHTFKGNFPIVYDPTGKILASSTDAFQPARLPENPSDTLDNSPNASRSGPPTLPPPDPSIPFPFGVPTAPSTVPADRDAVKLWDVVTGKALRVLKKFSADVSSIAFSPEVKQ